MSGIGKWGQVSRWVLTGGERGAVVRAALDGVHGDLLITPTMRWYRIRSRRTPARPVLRDEALEGRLPQRDSSGNFGGSPGVK